MFHQQIYDLSRQAHAEYNAQFERLYAPLQDEQPGLVRRLLAALRGFVTERKHKTAIPAHIRTAAPAR